MIKNERQYATTRTQIERMEQALAQLLQERSHGDTDDPIFRRIQEDGIRYQLAALRSEAAEYQSLKSGEVVSLELDSIEQLPYALIAGRISSGMTQKDLANCLGIREQMIQRYEATDYSSASFAKMRDVARALNLNIREEVLLPASGATVNRLFQRLEQEGAGPDFLKQRIVPLPILSELEDPTNSEGYSEADTAVRAATSIGKVLGFNPLDAFRDASLSLGQTAIASARLKAPANANEKHLAAYGAYAQYVASLALQAANIPDQRPLPTSASDFREAVVRQYGDLTYRSVLNFVWDLGIPVVPLNDTGAFHGALWRMEKKNVIILKQRTAFTSRWLVNLLHEFAHAAQEPEIEDFGVIDEMEPLRSWKHSPEEEDAVWFALDVALNEQAEILAQRSVQGARGSVERLTTVVPGIARAADVDVGVLADYIAFRLDRDGIANWWGAASNLQPEVGDPWKLTRNAFWDHVDISALAEFDQEILRRALM